MASRKKNDLAGADLHELAVIANKFHDEVEHHATSMVESAWKCGQALLAAKVLCEHGDWLPWLEANFQASQKTAWQYMTLASNYTSGYNLDPDMSITGALAMIEREREPELTDDDKKSGKSIVKRDRQVPASLTAQRFTRRLNSMFDDLGYIIQTSTEDGGFAAAAYDQLDQLTEQRDELTKLIRRLRKQFDNLPPMECVANKEISA
jgi:YD repeat-containing protein